MHTVFISNTPFGSHGFLFSYLIALHDSIRRKTDLQMSVYRLAPELLDERSGEKVEEQEEQEEIRAGFE